jgi:L-fucono-1,5-lactonase
MQMIVDTHVHVWDLDRAEYPWLEGDSSILNRNWTIEQLEDRKKAGVVSGVLVQASGNLEDTELMLETARNTDWIAGVVCWLPLADTSKTQELLEERFLTEKYCKGIRHQIHDEPNEEWLLQPAVIESLKLLAAHDIPYDVVAVKPAHVEVVMEISKKVPGLRMVFDHLSQPPIATKEKFGRWGQLMKEASDLPNLYAKISGLGTASGHFEGRTADDIKPYVSFVLEHFTCDRCFCGGDWPVSILADTYAGTWQTYQLILNELLNENEREKVFYSNANKFYDLKPVMIQNGSN